MLRRLCDGLMTRIPSQCAVCRAWPAQRLCADCLQRFARPGPRCLRCACALATGRPVCGSCLLRPPSLQSCHAVLDYGFPWSACIAEFKFQGDPSWAAALAPLMQGLPGLAQLLPQIDWLLPIPLSSQRLRERGYNQATLLARRLAPERTRDDLLQRLLDTPAQAGLGRTERLGNLRHSFALPPQARQALAGRCVLLIDDVMTTGATLEAAARVLRRAGTVREVHAAVLARTPAPG